MDVLQQIQADLLDQDAPLSTTLRRAKVLASRLRSDELGNWVSQELDGYKSSNELPDYRVIRTGCTGSWTNGFYMVTNRPVPLMRIDDDNLKELLTTFRVYDGIRTVEELATQQQHFIVSADITAFVNHYVGEQGYGYAELQYAVLSHEFEQILDTVKNRLLGFVLKLDQNWQLDDNPPSRDELRNLVSVVIYNSPQGGNVSVFDQRGQQVHYQYNAAGDINISAVQDKNELVGELEKLKGELERAKESKAIEHDTAVEAQYHLLQATKEGRKAKPDKGSFLEHIGKAKGLLDDVAAAAGLVTALLQAAEVASRVFG
jgi:hypothetical protein